ncbi:tropomyosin-1, isoforms 33/34-like [Sorex fumeus]|uniref:tropomyosin-1, isoforms 33/34-like n=1 Tax=Sorex fumeus TaxID=62283 RepID=UPI0024ADB98F|nr:tropomyosin-1, isoforms 33/34-like [Sorex fumeus]
MLGAANIYLPSGAGEGPRLPDRAGGEPLSRLRLPATGSSEPGPPPSTPRVCAIGPRRLNKAPRRWRGARAARTAGPGARRGERPPSSHNRAGPVGPGGARPPPPPAARLGDSPEVPAGAPQPRAPATAAAPAAASAAPPAVASAAAAAAARHCAPARAARSHARTRAAPPAAADGPPGGGARRYLRGRCCVGRGRRVRGCPRRRGPAPASGPCTGHPGSGASRRWAPTPREPRTDVK